MQRARRPAFHHGTGPHGHTYTDSDTYAYPHSNTYPYGYAHSDSHGYTHAAGYACIRPSQTHRAARVYDRRLPERVFGLERRCRRG